MILLVFALHVGLIFALSDRRATVPRSVKVARLRLVSEGGELLALGDPTLFALPHSKGFSAPVWLPIRRIEFAPFKWTEAPRFLALPVEQLGSTFMQFMQTNRFARFEPGILPPPELILPESPPLFVPRTRSGLSVRELEQRRLLNPPELPSWPAADLLTNSVVRVRVDAAGNVFSARLVPPGSGSKAADRRALELARALRFAPLSQPPIVSADPVGQLTPGTLVFEWHTVPPPPTNLPVLAP
jgi:TonB family protein